jgi:hypothetical protein
MLSTKQLLCRILVGTFIFLAGCQSIISQIRITDRGTPRALEVGQASAEHNDFGSISPYNGRLNYTLPLLQVGGRGEVGYAISLSIDSLLWVNEARQHTTTGGYDYYYDVPGGGGWHIENLRYMPGKLIGRSNLETTEPFCTNPQQQDKTQTRLFFVTSQGNEVTLVSRTHGDTSLPLSVQCIGGYPGGTPSSITPSSRGTEFVSDDGSATRFISDQEITDAAFGGGYFMPSGYLYFNNGTQC